jgi:hypothetical protein
MISKLKQTNLNQRKLIPLFISLLMLFGFYSQGNAQNIKRMDSFLAESNAAEISAFELLSENEGATLLVYDNVLELDGEFTAKVANVDLSSFGELYKQHPEFEDIELIRIRLKNPTDLNNKLEIGKLNQFNNLKYILLTVTFELCPENKTNIECQLSKINEMFTLSGESNSTIIFRLVSIM